jgi:Uma2 family endonuclease
LSKSTQGYDRGGKVALYRALPSLREYVLVSQSRVGLDLYTREAGDRWVLTPYTQLAECVHLESIGCTLGLAQVYAKVEWRYRSRFGRTLGFRGLSPNTLDAERDR